jgi:hypothetical protein
VVLEAIDAHAARLSGFSPVIDDVRGRLAAGAGAAASTPVSDSLEDLSDHLVARLVDYARAADALHRTVVSARAEYAVADARVARSAMYASDPVSGVLSGTG